MKRKCDTPQQALGAAITDIRVQRGWGYESVAEKAGCDYSYMLRIEHGTENPTLEVLLAIAEALEVKLSLLIARAERKYKNTPKKKS